jgi:hypothetical protein
MNTYKVLLPLLVHTSDASYKQGETFEHEFSEEDETANLKSGLLEIVPQTYKVVGGSVVHDTQPGEEFDAALPLGVEKLLVDGGHIERVEKKTPAKKPAAKKKTDG